MKLLESLKKIPKEHHNLNVFYSYPKDIFKITEVYSEVFSFYEKDKKDTYQSIHLKFKSSNIFQDSPSKPITVIELIEILERLKNDTVTDTLIFYISSLDLVYDCYKEIEYNTEGEFPCYII